MTAIANQNYDYAVAQVLKHACMVTRQGGDSSRVVQGIEAWRGEKRFPFELGMTTVSAGCHAMYGTLIYLREWPTSGS